MDKEKQNLLEESGYSPIAIQYFLECKHGGQLFEATTSASYKGSCGDIIKFMLKIEDDKIITARFLTIGCPASYAASEALSKIVEGCTLEDADDLTEQDIVDHLGSLPKGKFHCASIAIRAFRKALHKHFLEKEIL